MKMNKELENISKILRDHLHLTAAEVEGYLEGSFDSESARVIKEHLNRCHYCAREVDVIRDIVEEPEPGGGGLLHWLGIDKVVPILKGRKKHYDRFWLGDKTYSISTMKEYPDLSEVEELYLPELLELRRTDRNDPGSVPLAVEGQESPPVIALLSSFVAADGFIDPLEEEPPESDKTDVADFRFFAPILSEEKPDLRMRQLRALPGKKKKEKKPRPRLILTCRTKGHLLELFHEPMSDGIFFKIQSG
jgi:hypothetical protein